MRAIPAQAIGFITRLEGRRLEPYRDSAGYWTVGVGHLISREKNMPRPPGITEAQCDELLLADLERFANAVRSIDEQLKQPLTDNEFTALLSFSFNVGISAFLGSTLVKLLKRGDRAGAAEQLLGWTHAGGRYVEGLAKRRAAERELFLKPQPDTVGDAA